nr:ubiquitin carboxyl-terminal hydrolase 10-like isoform X2 [Leptinotarsa decemlineata]
MDMCDIRSIEFIDLSGIDSVEQNRIRTSLQQYDASVQLPWVKKTKTKSSSGRQQQRENVQTQEGIPEIQPIAVSSPYDYYPHTVISPTMYHQHPPVMVQPMLPYPHPQSSVIYYNALSPMSPPYPHVFVQQNPAVHGYPHNSGFDYQQTVEAPKMGSVVEDSQQNGQVFSEDPQQNGQEEEEGIQNEAEVSPPAEPSFPEEVIPNGVAVSPKEVIPNGVEVTNPTPAAKSWASLFKSGNANATSAPVNSFNKDASGHAVKDETNLLTCPIKHPRRADQFVDPDSYRMGEFLTTYTIDNRAVSLMPRGLLNESNYCYVNSILQALIACPPLFNLLNSLSKNISSNEKRKSSPVIDGMCRFVRQFDFLPANIRTKDRRVDKNVKNDQTVMVNTGIPFGPTWIYKMLHSMRTDWIEGRQQDAEEFLGFLLNGLNDEMLESVELVKSYTEHEKPAVDSAVETDSSDEWKVMGSKNKGCVTRRTHFARTPIIDIFGGQLKSSIHRAGDHITENIQPFLTLPLNIENVKTVREALEALVTKNRLEGLTSSKTNEQVEAWEQVMLCELPVILILHLKCFDYSYNGCTKIIKALEFGIDLKIDSKLVSSKTQSPKEKQYKLFAVVYHDGKEANKGHYVTDAFHVGYNCWLRYDDSSVKTIQEEHLLKPQGTRVPYLLFYRRSDTIRLK